MSPCGSLTVQYTILDWAGESLPHKTHGSKTEVSLAKSRMVGLETARHVAERFLAFGRGDCENPTPSGPRWTLDNSYSQYVLNTSFSAYEFYFRQNDIWSGYVIISGDRDIQPILNYSKHGPGLQHILNQDLNEFLSSNAIEIKQHRWIYGGPFDFIAEIVDWRGSYHYMRVPHDEYFASSRKHSFTVTNYADIAWVSDRWELYESDHSLRLSGPCDAMNRFSPVNYQQTCRDTISDEISGSPSNRCTPKCISGCFPVAWAVTR